MFVFLCKRKNKGVPYVAEIIPYEPDAVSTAGGIVDKYFYLYHSFVFYIFTF